MADIPFIKLFRTPNATYFLDVNKDEILPISKRSYNYLQDVLADNPNGTEMTEEIAGYKSNGYLLSRLNVQQLNHVCSQYLGAFLNRKLNQMILQVTQNCNFRCKYCIYSGEHNSRQRTHTKKHMSWDTARKAVDFLLEHSVDSKEVHLSFYGGEPLLEFELIEKIVDYSKGRFVGKKLNFGMTTNGTLLTEEKIRYLDAHNFHIMISLDGPKEINDQNRVFADGRGTFDAVIKKLDLIKEVCPELYKKTKISNVIDPVNSFDCINSIYIEGAELSELQPTLSYVDFGYEERKLVFSDDYVWKENYQSFLVILSKFNRFPKENVSPISSSNMLRQITSFSDISQGFYLQEVDIPSGPCIPGQTRLFVDVSGKLFPCERVSENSNAMCLGSIDDGFIIAKANHLLNSAELTQSECVKCWAFRYCFQCAKCADNEYGNLSAESKLKHCEESRHSAYRKITDYLLYIEIPHFYSKQIRAGQGN